MNVGTGCTDKTSVQKQIKFQGVSRIVDTAGRIAVPKKYLQLAGINCKDEVEMLLSLLNEIFIYLPGQNTSGYVGITRKIKDTGQIVIPAEYRRVTGLHPGSTAEILMTSQKEIIIRNFKSKI